MPRPQKCRRVCARPSCTSFGPRNCRGPTIAMAVDEYEVIRLIDLLGLTQEQCARQMAVARTTVQAIYATARKKLATCIVQGNHLLIEGGEVQFCEGCESPGPAGCSNPQGGGCPCTTTHKKEDECNE